jgi:hypothetical protein
MRSVHLLLHADGAKKEQTYASECNHEQTINYKCDTQTLNQGSDFVKGPDFHFLNAGKTRNQETQNWGKLCVT